MIRYVTQAYLDRNKYDLCIKLDPSALLYGYSWYLDTVCEAWDVLVLNDYDAVWPLPYRRKYGLKYFYRPFCVQQLGIFTKTPLDQDQINAFVSQMKKHCSFADLYFNVGQRITDNVSSIELKANRNFLLKFDRSYSSIYEGYNGSLRKNVKFGNRNTWSIFEHDNPEIIIDTFRNNKGLQLNLPEEFYRVFSKMMYACLHRNCGHLWTIYTGGNEICGGIFVTEFRGRLTLMFSALTENGRKLKAMPYLLNEYIIFQCGKYRCLDFEGSNDDKIADFYGGFGAEEQTYLSLKYYGLPFLKRFL